MSAAAAVATAAPASTAPILRCRGLTKRFGGLVAVNNVDLDLAPGEVLALVGDNGAGKSTMVQMISGVFRSDGGTIELDGEPRIFNS
ncbi:MAG: ATP-binding cassette domain-containing protein, partial [Rhizobiales bacterium]|nr:ATP-binding cassette domain-containing protein [Hyphomicrobiales bacterium]